MTSIDVLPDPGVSRTAAVDDKDRATPALPQHTMQPAVDDKDRAAPALPQHTMQLSESPLPPPSPPAPELFQPPLVTLDGFRVSFAYRFVNYCIALALVAATLSWAVGYRAAQYNCFVLGPLAILSACFFWVTSIASPLENFDNSILFIGNFAIVTAFVATWLDGAPFRSIFMGCFTILCLPMINGVLKVRMKIKQMRDFDSPPPPLHTPAFTHSPPHSAPYPSKEWKTAVDFLARLKKDPAPSRYRLWRVPV